jgi:hypothetical protein
MLATIAVFSSADHERNGGESTPQSFNLGNSRCILSDIRFNTLRDEPKKNTFPAPRFSKAAITDK